MQPLYGEFIYEIEIYDCFAKDVNETVFLLNILYKKELIFNGLTLSGKNAATMKGGIRIEEKGWIQIEEIEKSYVSKQVFVAMWFNSKMNDAFFAIEEACDKNGFKAFRIDNKEHNNEISGEILAEIRKSRFLISEVTGQRPGVYFEAGYALALGLPVIWCCREDELNKVHFDTRQYNHVVWTNEGDLISKLTSRIKGTIY
ncbi:nucleoside 2-deoxyribosyltransferase [Leptospira sp. 201903071]|nr:nucleoside 2-deoxyribosyltransferase [Leptospira ainazelensis]